MPKKIRPLDIITIIHILIAISILLIGRGVVENTAQRILIHLLILLFIGFLIKFSGKSSLLELIHDWYPLLLWGFFFETTTLANQVFQQGYWDIQVQQIDQFIFGYQPALVWGTKLDNFFWQEFFHFWYFSYYPMMIGIGILYYKFERKYFHQYFFSITLIFYISYFVYYFVPVIGGRFWQITQVLTREYRYGVFTRLMALIYNGTKHWGGALPSSHVSVATAVTIASFRYSKLLGWLFLGVTALLSISIVYCHYHYFIDIPAGILFGLILYAAASKLYIKMDNYV